MKQLSIDQLLHYAQTQGDSVGDTFASELLQLVNTYAREIAHQLNVEAIALKDDDGVQDKVSVHACFYPSFPTQSCPGILHSYDPEGQWHQHRHGTVLLCDDDTNVGLIGTAALERAGLTVLTSTSAEAALTLMAAHDIDLLITDIQLPGLSGHELAEIARTRQPGLAVITISGEVDDALCLEKVEEHGLLFHATKPANWARLVPLIRRLATPRAAQTAQSHPNSGAHRKSFP
ncbi:response regulator receiver domain protein [gamma proteobacterium NOR5-3]|nr:response regulator receiver domain protein [gamma proteobacterium NOR5-3]